MTLRARAGTTITFYATVYQDGTATNATSAGDVNVYDAATAGSIVTAGSALTPTALGSGVYSVAWPIDSAQAAGTYYPEWDLTAGGANTTPRSPTRSALIVLGAGTTQKELVLTDIKSTLESITTANGYKTAVATVQDSLISRDEARKGDRPFVGFGADQQTVEHYCFGTMRIQMPFTVVGYIQEPDDEDWDDTIGTINDLRDDIITAILADQTLGGSCTDVIQISDLDDTADPDRRHIPEDGGAVVLNFMVTYYRDTGSS